MKLKQVALFVAFFGLIAVFKYLNAEQGDFSTMGYDSVNGRSYWRVDSSGDLIPGVGATLDLGTSNYFVRTVYVGDIISSSTISGPIGGTTGSFSGTLSAGDAQNDTFTINGGSVVVPVANLFISSSTSGNSNGLPIMFLDATNRRVGIANKTPTVALDVLGAALISTNTTISGAVKVNDNVVVSSNVYVASGVVSSSNTIVSNYHRLASKAKATILGLVPVDVGEEFYCNNCINTAVCISSGTGRGAFVSISSPTAACDSI